MANNDLGPIQSPRNTLSVLFVSFDIRRSLDASVDVGPGLRMGGFREHRGGGRQTTTMVVVQRRSIRAHSHSPTSLYSPARVASASYTPS